MFRLHSLASLAPFRRAERPPAFGRRVQTPPPEPDPADLLASPHRRRRVTLAIVLAVALVALFLVGIAFGSVRIPLRDVVGLLTGGDAANPAWTTIVFDVRLPRTVAAVLCGAALGVAGLQMQTLFRNPLADPSVLGVTAGAGLGVAIVVLAAGSGASSWVAGLGWLGDAGLAIAAAVGAAIILTIVLVISRRVTSTATLVVIGIMVGYVVSAAVTVLVATASPLRLQQFVAWGFGSFRGVTRDELRVLAPVLAVGLAAAALTTKQLNALLLGERYAASMGVGVRRARTFTIVVAAVLAGTVTAFAGPIAFVGVAVPHLARALFHTSDHKVLVPAVVLIGAELALLAEVLTQSPGGGRVLPLNALTALLGFPVIVAVLVRVRRSGEAGMV